MHEEAEEVYFLQTFLHILWLFIMAGLSVFSEKIRKSCKK